MKPARLTSSTPVLLARDVVASSKFALVLLVLLIAGCSTRTIELAPIKIDINREANGPAGPGQTKPNPIWEALAKKTIGQESVVGQIGLGCLYYRQVAGRWPQTKEELAEGLASEKLSSDRLSDVQKLTFKEEGAILLVEFAATGKFKSSGTLRLDATKQENPVQPGPTKTLPPTNPP